MYGWIPVIQLLLPYKKAAVLRRNRQFFPNNSNKMIRNMIAVFAFLVVFASMVVEAAPFLGLIEGLLGGHDHHHDHHHGHGGYGYGGYPSAYGGYPGSYGGYPSSYGGYPGAYDSYGGYAYGGQHYGK